MKCIKCNGSTKIVETGRVFFGKVVVSPVRAEKCLKCGEEYLDEKEYESVRKKLEKIKVCTPEFQKIQLLVV
ncbi:MAG: YgiT-type zinc finger protein [Candidatus Diapherotrites archaeon]|nr:YgiT-type zinc finger protein [Candidatus Diapherotrites archaeon]